MVIGCKAVVSYNGIMLPPKARLVSVVQCGDGRYEFRFRWFEKNTGNITKDNPIRTAVARPFQPIKVVSEFVSFEVTTWGPATKLYQRTCVRADGDVCFLVEWVVLVGLPFVVETFPRGIESW